jgi:hypothetical protein
MILTVRDDFDEVLELLKRKTLKHSTAENPGNVALAK